jgi:rare lipoprotein A
MIDGNQQFGSRMDCAGLCHMLLLGGLIALLSGCAGSGGKDGPGDWSEFTGAPDAVPKVEPKSKYGNPASYVVFGKRYKTKTSSAGHVERGVASWYGKKFHGRKTSSGERYDMYAMTAAHKSLPLPTYAKVTNLENGRTAVVRINDRGPFHGDRVIDLSYTAARKLGVVSKGTAVVEVRAIDPRKPGSVSGDENLFAVAERAGRDETRPARGETVAESRQPKIKAEASPPALASVASGTARPEPSPASAKPILMAQSKEPASATPPPARSAVPAPAAGSASAPKIAASSPVPASAGTQGSSLYLQVGAFGNRTNAEQLRRQLVAQLAEQVQVRAGGDAALYKVRVGPFDSRQKVNKVSQMIASLGLKDSHVVLE